MWQPNHLERERLDKAKELQERGVSLYPPRSHRTHFIANAIDVFTQQETTHTEAEAPALLVTVVGRVRRVNIKGKISFMHIEDESGRLQLFMRINDMDEANYNLVAEKLVEMDDFVQATGTMMRTKTGEMSILVQQITLLSKAISPLPVVKQQVQEDGTVVEHGEFTDVETRYRQRYADLAVNQGVRDVFRKRALAIKSIREFLDDDGFLEVETPLLQSIYGGAAARPFVTHHNQLKQDLYLRISFELYLKRLLVGGYDAVYEIGRDFRNEGVSVKHNPEFTMLEFYKAYIDYQGVMALVERMVAYTCERVNGTLTIPYGDHTLNLAPPFKRMTMREAIREYAGIDYMDYPTAEALYAVVVETYKAAGVKELPKKDETWGRLVGEHLFSTFVEPKLIQPTYIMDYPRDISPFAKRVTYDDFHVERFELYMAGMEMGNAFTELNDPIDQQGRFEEMAQLYAQNSDEETPLDEDYLRAMRYGMPPNGGFGLGIDRFVMLLTNQRSIRDVLLYPHLRSTSET